MLQKTLNTRIKTKRDTAANWELKNPVLLNGEEIIVDTNAGEVRKKIGDGVKKYTQLPFSDEIVRGLINDKVDKVDGKVLSTNDYTTTEKNKLAGIAEGANKYVHPANHPATMITEDTTHRFVTDTEKTTWNNKASTAIATTSTNGLMSSTDKTKLEGIAEGANKYTHPSSHPATMITEDTTHKFVTDTEKSTWNNKASTAIASITANGLMSKDDKIKLNGIDTGANKTVVDTALSSTSTNPVQNKVINSALAGKAPSTHSHTKSQITDFPASMPASDVSAWAKAATKPKYTAAEVGADPSGSSTTALNTAKGYTDTKISDLINGAPTTLDTLKEIADAMATNDNVVKALEESIGNKANANDLASHTGNTTVHITSTERANWNTAKTHASSAHAPSNAEVNQNAFSIINTGDGTISAGSKQDTLAFKAGSNVSISGDTTNKTLTISATDTVYTHPVNHPATMITVDSTHRFVTDAEKTTWNNKASTAVATTSANGLMSASDKSNINSLLTRVTALETQYNEILVKLKTAVFYKV